MNREKYTLSLDEKKELTNIAIHEGFDKAFHRLMEIAVDAGYDKPKEKENPYAEKKLEKYYHCDLDVLIKEISASIIEIQTCEDDFYDTVYSRQIESFRGKLPLPILETLFQFNFYETFEDCQKLERVCNLNQLIEEATIAVLWAYKSAMGGEDATYFFYNFFYAIPVKKDGVIEFIKLLYTLDESCNDY